MSNDSSLKDIIFQMDRDILNSIVLSLAESNPEIEKLLKSYSSEVNGIYKAIHEQIKQVETAYKRYDWSDVDLIDNEMRKILNNIRELISDSIMGVELLKEFFELDCSVCENFDTDGGLEMNFDDAAVLFSHYAESYPDNNKLKTIIVKLVSNDNYGCRAKLSSILI